jgi:hypothetical protein
MSGIINQTYLYDEFWKKYLGGLIWNVFGSPSAFLYGAYTL